MHQPAPRGLENASDLARHAWSFGVECGKQRSLGLLHRLGRLQVSLLFGLSLQSLQRDALFELDQPLFVQERQTLQRRLHILVPVAFDDLAF